jgi:hypothetical protein
MTTLIPVFKLRSRRIVSVSLAIALANLGLLLYATRLTGQVPLGTNAQPVRALQEERLATLRKIADLVEQRRRQGGASMAEVALAKRNVAEAELELCTSPADRVTVIEKIVDEARTLESQAAQRAQDNLACQEVALAMKADLLRWQVRLEQARAELPSELNGSGQKPPQVGWASPPKR